MSCETYNMIQDYKPYTFKPFISPKILVSWLGKLLWMQDSYLVHAWLCCQDKIIKLPRPGKLTCGYLVCSRYLTCTGKLMGLSLNLAYPFGQKCTSNIYEKCYKFAGTSFHFYDVLNTLPYYW